MRVRSQAIPLLRWQAVTRAKALKEARRRWGDAARIWRVYWGWTFDSRAWCVGDKVGKHRIERGIGPTFEAAFADADARAAAKKEGE